VQVATKMTGLVLGCGIHSKARWREGASRKKRETEFSTLLLQGLRRATTTTVAAAAVVAVATDPEEVDPVVALLVELVMRLTPATTVRLQIISTLLHALIPHVQRWHADGRSELTERGACVAVRTSV
jgi:hypothetical protein